MLSSSNAHDQADLERFRRFLRPLAGLALVFCAIYAVATITTKSVELATITALLGVYCAATGVARRLADRGRLALAASIIAYGVLAFVFVGALLMPFAYPSLMVAALMSVAMALPYLTGSALRVLLGVALGVMGVIGIRGFTSGSDPPLPAWIRFVSAEGGAWAAAYLLLLLFWQFTARLKHTLEETRAAQALAEAARDEAAFLSEASRVLGASSLDYRETLGAVARLAVPTIADYCVIDELESDGNLRRVEVVHSDPSQQELLERLRSLDVTTADHPSMQVATALEPILMSRVDDARLELVAQTREHLAILRKLRPRSAIILPLVARGHALGSILLARTGDRPAYSPRDLELAKDLARRAALATDNARLYSEAQAAIRVRDEFLSIASHELRTPLTPLDLQIQSLRKRTAEIAVGGLSGEWLEKRFAMIARQSERLGRLVAELLDISRIANGRLGIELERMDLVELVHEIEERSHVVAEALRMQSELRVVAPREIVGLWDRTRVDQIVTNLLSNAFKYGAGNPVELIATTEDGEAVVSVTDHGIGIAAADQERIFERFERAAPSANFGGLGLGLFIARQLVEAMGGDIAVRSELGKGATFVVRLPLEPAQEVQPAVSH
jgi:signal transduction histidine kinase